VVSCACVVGSWFVSVVDEDVVDGVRFGCDAMNDDSVLGGSMVWGRNNSEVVLMAIVIEI